MIDKATIQPPESPLNAIYGENKLLLPLGPRIPFEDLPTRLSSNPFLGYNLSGLDATSKEDLLLLHKQNFIPTATAIDIAAALQNLHRENYWQRHINHKAVKDRARIVQLAQSKDFDIKSLPWSNFFASGMIIKGITGLGKTSIINRYTGMFDDQVYEHINGGIAGFDYVKQIVWLKVDMSSDGSRSGFLSSILLEIDRLINTDYAKQYTASRFSVDRIAVMLGVILSTHLCGLLIIDEIQEKNFNNSKYRNDLTTFFLRILNFGIPTVLIGSPLGFAELEKSSQDTRRLSSGGVYEMLPSLDGLDVDFVNLVGETLMFNVMERQNLVGNKYFREVAYPYSGGITDFVVRLNVESQLIALRSGDKEVLPRHIDTAFVGPRLSPNHRLITGLADRNEDLLRECIDVPVDRFLKIWLEDERKKKRQEAMTSKSLQDDATKEAMQFIKNSEYKEEQGSAARSCAGSHTEKKSTTEHLLRKFKTEQTRQANKHKKAIDQTERLSPNDIRGKGAEASLVAGLNELLKKNKKN